MIIKIFLSVFLFFQFNVCQASDHVFHIFANLTASSCTVNTENIYFNFYMNDIDLAAANSSSEWQELPGQVIQLTNCFSGTQGVDATVSGEMDSVDKDGFKNQADVSKAAGEVSIQLKSGNQVLHSGDVVKTEYTRTDGHIDIPLAARLYTTHGNVTSGDVYSVINLTLSYR